MFDKSQYFTVEQLAEKIGCSIQNIYQSIWRQHLRSIKYDGIRWVKKEWFDEWRANLKSKQHSWFCGRPTFDRENGEYSVKDVAKMLNKSIQYVYFQIRSGKLPCMRKGNYVVIHIDDLQKFLKAQKEVKYA